MNLQILAEFIRFFLFFFFSSNNKSYKMQMCYSIVLKFGTQEDDVSVYRGIKFGYNTVKL